MPKFLLNWYRKYRKKKYLQSIQGDIVECTICKSKFKEFGTFTTRYGYFQIKNQKCHKCHSHKRHRLLWMYLNDKTDLFKANTKIRLLHIAPEKVFYDFFSNNQHIEYFPCDLLPEKYAYEGKIKVKKADITNIPFKENYFDVIICSHVLEHIPDDTLAMSELYRVLKKEGWAILQVPIDYKRETTYENFSIITPEGREKAFGQVDHVRWYGRDYKDRLKSVGFIVNADNFVESFSQEEIFKFGLDKSELIYYCQKSFFKNLNESIC